MSWLRACAREAVRPGQFCGIAFRAVFSPYSALPFGWNMRLCWLTRFKILMLAASGQWVSVYFGWRPHLRDEGDNYLVELAVAGGAEFVVTRNTRDFERSELAWPGLRVRSPARFPEEVK